MALECCYFCGFADDTALSEHHIIPKRIQDGFDDRTVTVCRNCHKKLHDVIDPIVDDYVIEDESEEWEIKDESTVVKGGPYNRPSPQELVEDTIKDMYGVKEGRTIAGNEIEGASMEEVKDRIEPYVDDADSIIDELRQQGNAYKPANGIIRLV